jgi:hydrogenase maturation protein HypF
LVKRTKISIIGRVQGVGCRPFIYRLATELGLTGCVHNDNVGVTIEVQGGQGNIEEFLKTLNSEETPGLMEVVSCSYHDIDVKDNEKKFHIAPSDETGTPLSQVSPDIATCKDCLDELNDTEDFRYRYPFTNCTNCGPRYSIVKTIPYDRCNTTMGEFEMCHLCEMQYYEVSDRRFHAQPVACGACGPGVWLTDNTGKTIEEGTDETVAEAAKLLSKGGIIAIKGIGGFHLAVDALNNAATELLRKRKQREHKPFAMMARDIETISKYTEVDEQAKKLLQSPAAPIVLLNRKPNTKIAPSVAEGTGTLGFVLPYAPLHHLLFAEKNIEVLVMTSANISNEPLICDNDIALNKLGGIADAFLMHDREIYRQIDDSVVHIVDGKAAPLRRARGYVPGPVLRKTASDKQIFAAGGDLKNTFCFVKGNQYILSEHIGDLEDAEVYRHYVKSVDHLRDLFEVEPEVVVCDMHPGYLSTQYAKSLESSKLIQVQHHWAHIGSVLAEYDHAEPVIGIVADGTGYGTDGAVWGFECLIASLKDFKRFGHLEYYGLPGADKAAKEAIRPILGLLQSLFGSEYIEKHFSLLEKIEPNGDKIKMIGQQLEKKLNVVQTSSLGRLFDAVAGLAGVGKYNHFEAQLPMALEAAVQKGNKDAYKIQIKETSDGTSVLDIRNMLDEIVKDAGGGTDAAIISTRFHNGLCKAMAGLAEQARKTTGLSTVALSGGVFCNRYLSEYLISLLKDKDFKVLFKAKVPANDGGIALGQAAIAAEAIRE